MFCCVGTWVFGSTFIRHITVTSLIYRDDSQSRWKRTGDQEITRRHRAKRRRAEQCPSVAARVLQPHETARGEINGVHRMRDPTRTPRASRERHREGDTETGDARSSHSAHVEGVLSAYVRPAAVAVPRACCAACVLCFHCALSFEMYLTHTAHSDARSRT